MGRKSVLKSFKMLNQADLSTNQVSEITNVQNLDNGSIVLKWTGDAVGTITVEARNGEKEDFRTLAFGGGAILLAGTADEHEIIFKLFPFTDIRIQYTSTSGTGSIDATITAKVVGA